MICDHIEVLGVCGYRIYKLWVVYTYLFALRLFHHDNNNNIINHIAVHVNGDKHPVR